ncbi:MAG: GNAT family N-acetyltransferase [Eubacteriales bacterium]
MIFRRINLEKDKNTIMRFRKETHNISFGSDVPFDKEAYIERMENRIYRFPHGQIIVEEDDKSIGQLGLLIEEYCGATIGYVNLCYLVSQYRRKGIGKELIRYAENFFIQSKVFEYHLRVSATNYAAIGFYKKVGMVRLVEENERFPVWRMKKVLYST